jgi:hypothetical protein
MHRRRRLIAAAVMVGTLSFAPCRATAQATGQEPAPAPVPPPERGRTQGLKETEQFIKAGGTTSSAVGMARLQTQKTLDAYNALVTTPSKNMKGDYKKLLKSVDAMEKSVTEARQKVELMQQAGDVYFGGRAETIKNIQDTQLREQAHLRMADSQRELASVVEALRDAAESLQPFEKQLADQITYLGSDLNPSATASLKPNADKLNATGSEVFAKADKAITTANTYFQSLRASAP